MESGTGKGMMVVMPAFAQGGECHPDVISTLICCLEWTVSVNMADRVHAPCDVVVEENVYQSSPQESLQYPLPGPNKEETESSRESETQKYPEKVQPVHHKQGFITQ